MENLDRRMLLAGVGLVGAAAALSQAASAGQLNPPPGPVAPTGSTPVQSLTGNGTSDYVIGQPGAYHLIGNLGATKTNGILVSAEGVSIDLNGFEIFRSSGAGGVGIDIAASSHRATVRNGSITGFGYGVRNEYNGQVSAKACAFRDLTIGNCNGGGLFAGDGAVIESCRAHDISVNFGIFGGTGSTLSNCVASFCTGQSGITTGSGCSVINCSVSNCGLSGSAISAGVSSVLVNCTAAFNGGAAGIYGNAGCTFTSCAVTNHSGNYGILASPSANTLIGCTVRGCTVQHAIYAGVDSTVESCTAAFNSSAVSPSSGIYCGGVCTVSHCFSSSNTTTNATPTGDTGIGFLLGGGSTIQGCAAYANSGDGIQVTNDCIVLNNECVNNGTLFGGSQFGSGLHVTSSANRIEGNNLGGNHHNGLKVDAAGNIILRNSARGNGGVGGNYNIVASNRYGAIVDITAAGSAAVSGNTATSVLATTDPWANFAY